MKGGSWSSSMLCSLWVLSCIVFIAGITKLHFNHSQSSSYEAFICVKGMKAERGDFVSIQGHQTEYFKDLNYIKRLQGHAGDSIDIREGQMFVANGLIGDVRSSTRSDLALAPLRAGAVHEGSVFVAGDHPYSFDSRYEEFGLVHKKHIKGRCFGLWRRKETGQ